MNILERRLIMSTLERRLIDITYQEKLSHLSSTISALPIIEEIYSKRKDDEVFILSNGHAGLALYVVLEKYYGVDPVAMVHEHGIHPSRDLKNHLYCSTGSLGSGLPIAVGHALATPDKKVYCMISDGECAEGSIWEALRYIKEEVPNLEVYVNVNGMGAYDDINVPYLVDRLLCFLPRINIRRTHPPRWSFAENLLTHYYVLKPEDYAEITA
jgi:transketolase